MKNTTFFIIFLLVAILSFATKAQSPWLLQRVSGLPNSVNPAVTFSAVDNNICWGININNSQYVRTTNGGVNWTVSTITGTAGLHGSCIYAIDSSTAYAAMYNPSNITSGGVFKTTDGGATWENQNTAFPGSGGHPADIHFFDSNNGVVIGNPHSGNWEIYTTTNGGVQWDSVSSIPAPFNGEFTGDGNYSSAGDNIWFGTVGPSANNFAIYRSTDRGYNWERFSQSGKVTFCLAFKDSSNGLAVNPFEGGNKVSRTTDGGVTWTSQTVPSTHSAWCISYVKGTPGSYVITSNNNTGFPVPTSPGSSYSNDDGLSWTHIDNLPHGSASFSSWNNGWSACVNDSVYKWVSDILITSVEEVPGTFDNFILEQNYPNPFNPSTTIKYSIPTSEFVMLKVYDVLGNEVAVLVNEEKPAGEYEVEFSAKGGSASGGNTYNLSSGIYFYALQAGSYTQTKKLILMK